MGPTKAKEFPAGSKKAQAMLNARVKGSAVTGIATDALNRMVVISTMDGKLSWYDFTSTELLHRTHISAAGISSIQLHRDSNLLLVVSDDLVLRLVDDVFGEPPNNPLPAIELLTDSLKTST